MRFRKSNINLGKTQNEIFKNILKRYFNTKYALDEYDFIFCLSLTYYHFRDIRKTVADKDINQDFSTFVESESKLKTILGVFPICDAVLDQQGKLTPRFLKKFSEHMFKIDEIKVHYRVARSQPATSPLHSITISTREIITKLNLTDWCFTIGKIAINVCKKRYFWRCSIHQKLSLIKSLFLFEANFLYFSTININYIGNYEKLYLTNFYSPENLGLIKAFLFGNKEVVDLQHGVQKNVVAYEHRELLPKTIKPTKFLTWFYANKAINEDEKCQKFDFKEIIRALKNGTGLKILVSLQPSNSEKFLRDLNLLNLLQHSVKIRPHPRRLLSKDDFSSYFSFDFEYDNNFDIYQSLCGIDVHLTEYSSCVLDGLNLGVPSICFHPIANEYFDDVLSSNLIKVYDSVGDFLTNEEIISNVN